MSGIRARLLLLVTLAIVPLFAFTLYQGIAERRRAAARERADARRLVLLFAAEHQRVVSDARRLLFVLAQGPTIRAANVTACTQLFRAVLDESPAYSNLMLAEVDGRVIAAAKPVDPDGDDRALLARAAASTFVVGRIERIGAAEFPTFGLAHAVEADDGRTLVLLARTGMDWIADEFVVAGLGPGTRVTLWDASGRIVLRYPDPEGFLGRDASASEVWSAIRAAGGEGSAEARGGDGVPRLYGFTRLDSAPGGGEMTLSLGVPSDVAFEELRRLERRNLLALVLATIVGAVVAYRGAERLARIFGGMQRLAERDPLTGLPNRRRLMEGGQEEHRRALRLGHPLAALMLDIDRFKLVNDRHGHGAGDDVLKEVARRIQDTVREIDLPARYGGEEFAVLLPDSRLEKAQEVAERIRLAVAATPITTRRGPLSVTLSAGVAEVGGDGGDLTAVLEAADGALYAAKEGGRNRVVAAAPSRQKATPGQA